MGWLRETGVASNLHIVENMIKKGELGEGKQKEAFQHLVEGMRGLLADVIEIKEGKRK
ncbi:MAG: hypothetical protein KJ623_03260 [Nanoarchaeota archaeon]|nr:hypothetical protein [Nanoarchaeota archaeon]MBU0962836.1 hypothetical protein [Nanoarchaeota archaeon]